MGEGARRFLHNVMPLISDPAHGHAFRPDRPARPDRDGTEGAAGRLDGGGAKLMRHCRQCRADAVGLLGEDRGQEFTKDLLPEEVVYDPPSARPIARSWPASAAITSAGAGRHRRGPGGGQRR